MPVLGDRGPGSLGSSESACFNQDLLPQYAFRASAQLRELRARATATADPKRLFIINELRDRELSVGELCEATGISQSNASQHLTILRERGIVTTRHVKSNVFYSLRSQKLVQAVDLFREFLAEDLADHAALERAIRG